MKYFLLLAALLVGCSTSPSNPTNPTDPITPVDPVIPQPPSHHEKPMKISDEGLKMGGIKELGTKYIVNEVSRQFSPVPPARPVCAQIPVVGSECAQGAPVCMNAQGTVEYTCAPKTTYKVFGWIYEKNGLDYSKMAKNVKVDIFWFAGCWVGFCNSVAGPVYTDEFGYFELTTGSLMDTVRIDGMPKYYAFCKDKKPIAGGGQYISSEFVGKAIGPFKQMLVKPDTCND